MRKEEKRNVSEKRRKGKGKFERKEKEKRNVRKEEKRKGKFEE